MKKHTATYLRYFGLTIADFICCEVCWSQDKYVRAVDCHHIEARGMGGSEDKDAIENLQAICRAHHLEFGDRKQYKELLKTIHADYMKKYGKK